MMARLESLYMYYKHNFVCRVSRWSDHHPCLRAIRTRWCIDV